MSDLSDLVNAERLTQWLDDHLPALGDGPLHAEQLHGGTSNVILTLNRGKHTVALRRPPAVPPPNSEKSIAREARVLTALNATDVPHPRCYGFCADPAVIGAPFYLMELVTGWAAELRGEKIHHHAPFDHPEGEREVAFALVDGLITLANVDYREVGLEDFGKPGNFLARQVDRWESQLNSYARLYGYAGREIPGFAFVRDWLRANVPDDSRNGIMHGDCGTPNALFAFDRPARLVALIDWELSTIGDPLLDLAWFTNSLRDEGDAIDPGSLYNQAYMPSRQELARHYAAGTGRDLGNFDYYCALSAFKSGCILEYKVAQAAAGILTPETGRLFERLVRARFARAEALCRKAG